MTDPMKPRSHEVTDGYERAPARAMLRAVGMSRGHLRGMVRWEAALVAVYGTLLGLGVGLFLGWSLVFAIKESGIETARTVNDNETGPGRGGTFKAPAGSVVVLDPRDGVSGSGVISRYPLTPTGETPLDDAGHSGSRRSFIPSVVDNNRRAVGGKRDSQAATRRH